MTLIRDPLLAAQTILIGLVPLTFIASAYLIFGLTYDDRWVNDVSGAVALLGAALALCRVWSDDTDQRAGLFWLVASIGFSVLAISQWYEDRLEAVEHALRIENLDDVLLLLVMPPIILIGIRSRGVGWIVKAVLLLGFLAQVVSTGIDLLDDWAAPSLRGGYQALAVLVNHSELVFLQLYLTAFAMFAAAEIFGPRWSGKAARGPLARPARGLTELLDILLEHGLTPDHTVVDYGCGSFRLGLPLIEYLEPGRYLGLGVREELHTFGMASVSRKLAAKKRPRVRMIDAPGLAEAKAALPDFIVSWHVCSKVPPERLSDYFGKMISLMGHSTLVLVHFHETDVPKRQSRFSWSESREAIASVIREIDPGLEIAFAPVMTAVRDGVRQTMVAIRR